MKTKLLAGLYVLALALVVCLADARLGGAFFAYVHGVPLGDKLGHFVLAGLFALALDAALSRRTFKFPRAAVPAGSALALALMTLEECSQIFFRARSFDLADLLSDYLGVACAVLLAYHLKARAARPQPCEIGG
jgi:polysaccharide biosynthesis protein VpsQ